MAKILKLGLTLMIIAAISGISLALVYNVTSPIIEERQAREIQEGLKEVVSVADVFEPLDEDEIASLLVLSKDFSAIQEAYVAYSGTEVMGLVFSLNVSGYGGDINMLVGVLHDESVSGLKIMSHSETAGLGSKIKEESFTSQFIGAYDDARLKVDKEGGTIAAISSATISSKAVVKGTKIALEAAKLILIMFR